MNKGKQKGFIITSDSFFKCIEIEFDNLLNISIDDSLTHYINAASIGKLLSFFNEIKSENSAVGWEINFNNGPEIYAVYMAGIKDSNSYTIIGSTDAIETRKYFNDLTIMYNESLNILRGVVKENEQFKIEKKHTDESFNELTKINNEMTNLQRELAQKYSTLKALNQELENKNNELDQFAYIVSHDLKAPLRAILGVTDIISSTYSNKFDEELTELFELISKRASRMDELINAILSYTRAGSIEIEISTFSLNDLLIEIIDSIAPPSAIQIIMPSNPPTITGSYVMLSQVLTNLIHNAVKYHDKKTGTIKIECRKTNAGYHHIFVIDDGPGIPEKYQQKVFGVFETANQKHTTANTGVGLAIVKKLVKLNGGDIKLTSEYGKGSTFSFTWPKV